MANIFEVTKYILESSGEMTAMKLQKLAYYSQAWALVWDEEEMFSDPIEAWANGPVVRRLYEAHRGAFKVDSAWFSGGDASKLTSTQKETIDAVLETYGNKSSQWLSDLTHMEDPWKQARAGLPETARSNKVITLESMAEYYGSLPPE